ncbi:uncharacterized protein CLAFUR5_10426 [Fulvia fulva]|uniref:Uncharacterized protein n=1 Tax=Passalora fulva TaxID=5499 RepID=A0A9Q8PD89_PASFU|nr:uncharacterized protein CLAFUR5_10426 [Fulvia fulva]UJO20406.1 hypothetical protein CLAFUR5_10426 [Fulvia fulva]
MTSPEASPPSGVPQDRSPAIAPVKPTKIPTNAPPASMRGDSQTNAIVIAEDSQQAILSATVNSQTGPRRTPTSTIENPGPRPGAQQPEGTAEDKARSSGLDDQQGTRKRAAPPTDFSADTRPAKAAKPTVPIPPPALNAATSTFNRPPTALVDPGYRSRPNIAATQRAAQQAPAMTAEQRARQQYDAMYRHGISPVPVARQPGQQQVMNGPNRVLPPVPSVAESPRRQYNPTPPHYSVIRPSNFPYANAGPSQQPSSGHTFQHPQYPAPYGFAPPPQMAYYVPEPTVGQIIGDLQAKVTRLEGQVTEREKIISSNAINEAKSHKKIKILEDTLRDSERARDRLDKETTEEIKELQASLEKVRIVMNDMDKTLGPFREK